MGLPAADGTEVSENGGANSSSRDKRAHILMLMFDEQGHFVVFLQLLYFLSSFDSIIVTVCTTERRVKQLEALLSDDGKFKSLDLRLVQLSTDVSGTADKPGAIPPLWQIAKDIKAQFQAYRQKLATETNPDAKPTCLVADLLLDWTEELAKELHIPRYLVFTTAAWFAFTALRAKIEPSNKQTGDDEIVQIPGRFGAPVKEIPSIIFPLLNLRNLAGILINTYEELEGEECLEAVRTYLQHMTTSPPGSSQVARFLPVGPMAHIPAYSAATKIGAGQGVKALEWLDKRSPSSVLYVAFGTMANVPRELVFELARGLELSGVPFLWVLRHSHVSTEVSTLLPPGFLERVKTKGFVETAWAPQLQILQHPSTGGFMSHCGWNSSLESISSGVPILTWHMHGDQPLNARFIVEGLKVGLPLRQPGSNAVVVSGEDVAAVIKSLMVEDKGKELRKNSARFKELAVGSMQAGGSSDRNLHQFVDEILTH